MSTTAKTNDSLARAARDAATLLGRAAEIAFAQASLPGSRSAAATKAMNDFEGGARRVLAAIAAEAERDKLRREAAQAMDEVAQEWLASAHPAAAKAAAAWAKMELSR